MKLTDIIFEAPQEIEFKSHEDEKEFNKYIRGVILDSIKNKEGYQHGELTNNIYFVKKGSFITYYYSNDGGKSPIAGVYSQKDDIDGKTAIRTAVTIKFDDKYENAALKLYSYISKNVTPYLVSDTAQTAAMVKNWQKWLVSPSKYGIKEIYIYDKFNDQRVPDNDIKKYWGKDIWFWRFRVIARWV